MTIVVGFCCGEGIVIASDSQISSGATRRWEQKVWKVDHPGLVFGLAGAESTMHLLRDYFLGTPFDTTTANHVQITIMQAVSAVLKPQYDVVRSLIPAATPDQLPLGQALIGVYAQGAPHLFQLDANGLVTDHHARGFAAIGTGASFADHAATIFRKLQDGMTLHQAKMLASRVVQDAISAAGPAVAVGGKVQMATVSSSTAPPTCELLAWDDPVIKDAVDGWLELEAVRFQEHVPPGEADGTG